jgi:hypothetical protein
MTNPPKPIAEFFRLKNAEDEDALPLLFSEDAIAIAAGERKERRGREEIMGWIEKSISGLRLPQGHSVPLDEVRAE